MHLHHGRPRCRRHHAQLPEQLVSRCALSARADRIASGSGVRTMADRDGYLRRPDLGRVLDDRSGKQLMKKSRQLTETDVAIVIADGLSALAVERHAIELLDQVIPSLMKDELVIAPLVIVEQGRVAIGDQIGEILGARIAIVLIGERPGLSSPDSLGIYLTY